MELHLDLDGYVGEVRRGAELIARAAGAGLDEPVVSCSGWTQADLLDHVGSFLSFWSGVLSGRTPAPAGFERTERVADAELLEWFRERAQAATDDLAGVGGLDVERWNWSGRDLTSGWIARRMAAELAVHAWDATGGRGGGEPVPTAAAIDGVDEFLDGFAPFFADRIVGEPLTVHLHATDGDGEWLWRVAPGSIELERGHAKGDVAVRAPASDLFLLCWGRVDPGDLEVFGDLDRLRVLLDAVRI